MLPHAMACIETLHAFYRLGSTQQLRQGLKAPEMIGIGGQLTIQVIRGIQHRHLQPLGSNTAYTGLDLYPLTRSIGKRV